MMRKRIALMTLGMTAATIPISGNVRAEPDPGWNRWRGPLQSGVGFERYAGKPADGALREVWSAEIAGRGAPVVHGGRVYSIGYEGTGADLREFVECRQVADGKLVWRQGFNDFISDTIYSRYGIGSPIVDPETGRVYALLASGLFTCFDADGKPLWQHSLMESVGRLTFPNGRTGSPVLEGDLAIVRGITTNWGKQGPPRDRFYAFDKTTGEQVWVSAPGVKPRDSSYSTPFLDTRYGRRVFYAGTGCGNIVAVSALDGKPLWRFQMSKGGVNSSPIVHNGTIICIHGKENLDTTEEGRMVAIRIPRELPADGSQLVLGKESEVWRNPLNHFTSSPVLVRNRVYQLNKTGELNCVDGDTGAVVWKEKLGPDNLHSSPAWADGLLYVPVMNGSFYVIKPADDKAEILQKLTLEGNCIGAASIAGGRVYVHTTKKLYCFSIGAKSVDSIALRAAEPVAPGKAVALRVVPSEVLLRPGQSASFRVSRVDARGNVLGKEKRVGWEKFIPPTAKVKAKADAEFNADGVLAAAPDAKISAGAFKATSADGLSGTIRARLLPRLPYREDFENFDVSVPHAVETDVKFAYPPLPWIGARFKWEIREVEGNKMLAKTTGTSIFQRATTFVGDPNESGYTIQADVMTDGNRRTMGEIGVVNQRYLISLKGNAGIMEISSNHERIKEARDFPIKAKTWYTLKARVDVKPDGSGVVRGKAWPRGEAEPEAWVLEVSHRIAHKKGAPGVFGFFPLSRQRVYIDNISIVSN